MSTTKKSGRLLRNFALQPMLQIKLGLYSIVLAISFGAMACLLIYFHLGNLTTLILNMSGVPDEIKDSLSQYIGPIALQLFSLAMVYISLNLLMTLVMTHRLVGPAIAFRRHIQMIIAGDLTHRTTLRKYDAFSEVAEDLNRLSAMLESKPK